MELSTKYQYTYFIYPYVIDSKRYHSYLQNLLRNKRYKWIVFETAKDMNLYQYFLPDIRKSMFWPFELTKDGIKSFEKLNVELKANLLAEHDCNIFEYELPKDLQGKIGEKGGIFFDISDIKLVCYKTGICFLLLKTNLVENKNFTDVLNFNYKFREITSKTYKMKEYENIKLQSDNFKDVQEISNLIKEIIGNQNDTNNINVDDEKMLVYSYTCLDQSSWNDETSQEIIDGLFEKYRLLLPASAQMADSVGKKEDTQIYENNYMIYGFSNFAQVLLTSDVNTVNYTITPQKFENEYLYTYILELYKKLLLKKINEEFNNTLLFKDIESGFLCFTKKLWIQEVTNDELGTRLCKKWHEKLGIEEIFLKLKSKYDILYKRYNVEKTSKKNGRLAIAIVVLIIIGVINIILQL